MAEIASELRLRAKVGPSLWPEPLAAFHKEGDAHFVMRAVHARLVEPPLTREAAPVAAAHALAKWKLALAHRGLPKTCFWRRDGGIALASNAVPQASPREASVNALRNLLGPVQAAADLLGAALSPLPDLETQSGALAAIVDAALGGGIPQVIAVPDFEQAQALCALLMAHALERGISISADKSFKANLRLLGPARAAEMERSLARAGEQATVAVVLASRRECERTLSHLATVHGLAAPRRSAWLEWLREIGIDGALVVEELAPVLERNIEEARRLVLTLIGRSGAVLTPDGANISARWQEEWREMLAAPAAMVHPQASRLARLLRASPAGLSATAVEASAPLAQAARAMLANGSAMREGSAIMLAPGVSVGFGSRAQRQSDLRWLAERPQLCPFARGPLAQAWLATLQLNGGELSAWDAGTNKLLRALLEERGFESAASLLEAHALAASRRGVGPPDLEALLITRALGLLLWPPKRLRRVYRMWLRGYEGEWRATLLALLAQVERALRGPQKYPALIEAALVQASRTSRVGREQAWVECATCLGPDEPARARTILKQLGAKPAQDARLHTRARALIAQAYAEFVSVRIAEALELLRQARDVLGSRAGGFLHRRVLGEIEALTAMYVGVLSGGERAHATLMAPLLELEQEHGGLADLVSRATINDQLFRLRRFESGSFDPREIEFLLAEARPENRRGYMVLLNQLCENAVYRCDMAAFARLGARIEALAQRGPLDVIVEAAWKRHGALKLALAGNLREALRLWRQSRAYHAPAPWNRRSAFIRHGEWGFMLMLAGKFERAAQSFFRATRELRGMEVTGRAAPFCALGAVACVLAGRPVPVHERLALKQLAQGEYAFAQLIQRILEAVHGGTAWADAQEYLQDHAAVASWKGVALTLGAVMARKSSSPQAPRLAAAARKFLGTPHRALLLWLEAQFPANDSVSEALSPAVAQALAEFSFAALDPPPVDALIERAARLLSGAVQATVLVRVTTPTARHTAFAGNPDFRADLDAFGAELPVQGLLRAEMAGVPSDLAGMVVFRCARAATSADLAAARAFCRRIDEYVLLAEARDRAHVSRRREQALSQVAWEFARGTHSLSARLEQLAILLETQSGAKGVSMWLERKGRTQTTPMRARGALHTTCELESGLGLNASAVEGDELGLRRGLEQAARVVGEWLRDTKISAEHGLLEEDADEPARLLGQIVGESQAAREFAANVRRYADLDLSITIVGESGSGKDFAARALHSLSRRSRGEHVVVDCATLRRETAASELFGHVRGAFTGATADHTGMLARSHIGTLQLDNVAELSPDLQALLLRALEERRFMPVGGQRELAFDARVLVTTAQTLDALVAEKRLRLDFAQRLGGLTLSVPPLRDRRGDAELLAGAFLAEQAVALGRALRFDQSARDALKEHDWPGNIRELRSALARACALADGTEIRAHDLVTARHESGNALLSLPREKGLKSGARVMLALARSLGEITPREAASALGVSRTTASLTLTALARADYLERTGNGRSTGYRVPG